MKLQVSFMCICSYSVAGQDLYLGQSLKANTALDLNSPLLPYEL